MIVAASFEPFALWLAEHERPEWRAKPLVKNHSRCTLTRAQRDRVVGLKASPDHSPAARQAGVRLGMSLAGARQQVPELVVVAAGGPYLQAAWESLVLEASAVSSRFEPLRVGLLAFEGERADARQFAAAYRARVGLASSVERAHLLAVSSFAGRVREGGDAGEADLLMRMPLRLLRGLGLSEQALIRLHWLGIERVGQLLAWQRRQLLAFLGAEGEVLARALFGPFRTHLQRFTPPPRIGAALAFDEPACEPAQLVPALAHLVNEAARALGDRTASLVTIKAAAAGIRSGATRRAKEPLSDPRRLLELALLALADTAAAALGIDGLTLELGGLRRGGVQESWWRQRQELEVAVKSVSNRFPHALLRLVEVDPYAFETERRFELRQAHTGELVPWREVAGAAEPEEAAGAARRRSPLPVSG